MPKNKNKYWTERFKQEEARMHALTEIEVRKAAKEYYHLESDWVIEIDITANHGDALSHYGVARDFYAWLKQNGYTTSLHRPDCSAFKVDNEDLKIDVDLENTDACKRYSCISISGCIS